MKHLSKGAAFGVYVHWPFCESKCPYCDFNSHVAPQVDHDRWLRAFRQEIKRLAEDTSDEVVSTVFFGGGTPSLMEPHVVAGILDAISSAWRQVNDPEVTLEANPGSVELSRFKSYKDAGVNRISIGVQSLDDTHLRKLGRSHSAADARHAISVGQRIFDRVSIDLIYARQNQTAADWESELSEALNFGTEHLSAYQLTVEDGTVFGRRAEAGKLRGLPDEDTSVEMYELTQALCESAGLPAYETSNHARPGFECRHNLIYWEGGQYAGVGPGAHGRLVRGEKRFETEGHRQPGKWLQAVEAAGSGEALRQSLSPMDQLEEAVMMGLRLRKGILIDRLTSLGLLPAAAGRLRELSAEGFIEIDSGRIRTTRLGGLLLNSVIREVLLNQSVSR